MDENGAQHWAEAGRARVADGASSWLDDHGRDLDHALIGGALHDGALDACLDGDPGALDHALDLGPALDGGLDGRHAGERLG